MKNKELERKCKYRMANIEYRISTVEVGIQEREIRDEKENRLATHHSLGKL
jgi:hypothetical protein